MTAIFKTWLEGKEYVFHRTVLNNEVVYFVLFTLDGERTSLQVSNKRTGNWEVQHALKGLNTYHVNELVYAIAEKEKN